MFERLNNINSIQTHTKWNSKHALVTPLNLRMALIPLITTQKNNSYICVLYLNTTSQVTIKVTCNLLYISNQHNKYLIWDSVHPHAAPSNPNPPINFFSF